MRSNTQKYGMFLVAAILTILSLPGFVHGQTPGTEKWRFPTGSNVYSSPAIGADGTIYVGSVDNNLYAIHSTSPGLADTSWPMFHHDLKHTGRVEVEPVPDIKANGSDGPVTITQLDNLSVTVALDPGIYSGVQADWWVLADTPVGWYRYDVWGDRWIPGMTVTYQGPLGDLGSYEVLNISGLPLGDYTFYFGVDGNVNGVIDDPLYYDSVEVNITPLAEGDPAGSWIWNWEENPEYGTYGNYVDSVVECDIPAELSDQCFVDYLADQGVGIGDIIAVWTTPTAPIIPYNMTFGDTCWEDWSHIADRWVYIMELNNGDFLFMEVTDDGVDHWGFLVYVGDYSQLEDGGNVDFGSVLAIEDCSQPVPYEANILLRLERGDVFTPNMCP